VIDSEVGNLRTALGEAAAAKLDQYLQTEFAPNVTAHRAGTTDLSRPAFQTPLTKAVPR
jgi:hypothetical protein